MEVATGVSSWFWTFITVIVVFFWCQQWVYLGKWIECSIMSINSILGGCSCHDVTRWFAKSCYKASRSGCLMSPSWNWISGMDPTMNPLVLSASVEGSWTSWFISSLISGASSALKPDRGSQVFNSLGRGGTTCASPAVILPLADIHWSLVTMLLLVTVISLFTC